MNWGSVETLINYLNNMATNTRLQEGKEGRNAEGFREGFDAISFKDKASSGVPVPKADLPAGMKARIIYPSK
jgi:hypothetical protein